MADTPEAATAATATATAATRRAAAVAAQVAPAAAAAASADSSEASAAMPAGAVALDDVRTRAVADVLASWSAAHAGLQDDDAAAAAAESASPSASSSTPRMRWNGWGYADTGFSVNAGTQEVELLGSRYLFSGKSFPSLRPWCEERLGLDMGDFSPAQAQAQALARVPPADSDDYQLRLCPAFVAGLDRAWLAAEPSTAPLDRLAHAHGHTCEDIWKLRWGSFERVPDMVLWPRDHAGVAAIVALAAQHAQDVCVIPFGGGTSVCHGVEAPAGERRMVVTVDLRCMTRVLWYDEASRLVCVEAGCVGKELEATLAAELGVCTGHEPDSSEFSTVGGWVATRASGMKKNVYGNIEDIVVGSTLVTPTGVLERGSTGAPRISCGLDTNQLALGSEGNFGIVTRAVLKVRPVPRARKYGSVIFRTFDEGVAFMEALAAKRLAPASVRLVDNPQFQLGALLKPPAESYLAAATDAAKKAFVTKILGFDVDQMVAATITFEGGSQRNVDAHEAAVYAIAKKHGGVAGGEENGVRGYFLTYMIAYVRDLCLDYNFMAESFETSVPWSEVRPLCDNTKERIFRECEARGIKNPYVSCRVTQTYDSGAAVYFYFGFVFKGLEDPIKAFSEIEAAARDECLANGGSVSHHHGIGKLRQPWVKKTQSERGVAVLRAVKQELDPNNVFAVGNILPSATAGSASAAAAAGKTD